MAERNGNYDWSDRMRRLEESVAASRNLEALRTSIVEQRKNVDNLVSAIRDLIDHIPPENLKRNRLSSSASKRAM